MVCGYGVTVVVVDDVVDVELEVVLVVVLVDVDDVGATDVVEVVVVLVLVVASMMALPNARISLLRNALRVLYPDTVK